MDFKIIQSSPKHTGSTLLLNLIHGFLSPDEAIHWDTERLIDKYLITKTHNLHIEEWENKYQQYKLFFIMSERNDSKVKKLINEKYKQKSNVLIINYDKLLETDKRSINDIIDYVFDIFINFIPKELHPQKDNHLIKEDMKKRINKLNETVERMKDKSFELWDRFTGIHGSHRNRKCHSI
tara:strand:+ start:2274 stop:2813 length:540 start_codon:yes stop_codon:yes gene_type:complete